MIKNFFSHRLFGVSYDRLPLASEIICDLHIEILRNKIFTFLFTAAFIAILTACALMR